MGNAPPPCSMWAGTQIGLVLMADRGWAIGPGIDHRRTNGLGGSGLAAAGRRGLSRLDWAGSFFRSSGRLERASAERPAPPRPAFLLQGLAGVDGQSEGAVVVRAPSSRNSSIPRATILGQGHPARPDGDGGGPESATVATAVVGRARKRAIVLGHSACRLASPALAAAACLIGGGHLAGASACPAEAKIPGSGACRFRDL